MHILIRFADSTYLRGIGTEIRRSAKDPKGPTLTGNYWHGYKAGVLGVESPIY